MSAALDALTRLSSEFVNLLDIASIAWLVVAVLLMLIGEFESVAARRARWALAPLALLLGAAFAVKLLGLFVPMLGFGSA